MILIEDFGIKLIPNFLQPQVTQQLKKHSSQLSAVNKLAQKSILLFAMCVKNLLILSSLSLVYCATLCCILLAVSSTPLGMCSKSVVAHWKSLCLTCSRLSARFLSFSAWIEIQLEDNVKIDSGLLKIRLTFAIMGDFQSWDGVHV